MIILFIKRLLCSAKVLEDTSMFVLFWHKNETESLQSFILKASRPLPRLVSMVPQLHLHHDAPQGVPHAFSDVSAVLFGDPNSN